MLAYIGLLAFGYAQILEIYKATIVCKISHTYEFNYRNIF